MITPATADRLLAGPPLGDEAETYDAQTPDLGSISADIRKKLPLPKP